MFANSIVPSPAKTIWQMGGKFDSTTQKSWLSSVTVSTSSVILRMAVRADLKRSEYLGELSQRCYHRDRPALVF